MPDRKSRRDHATRIVQEAAKVPVVPAMTDYELALKSAVLAEGTPKEDLVRRIVCEWLREKGYLA